jgi:uncharacterized membrane protein YecN with MAPEG domain
MISTPTTSPSSDGATFASVTIASITPRDLSDQYGAVDTAAKLSPSTLSSTPSLSPENTHAAADAAGSGNSNQDRPVNNRNRRFSRLESVFGLTHAEGKDADLTRMMCGSMFAYVVLGIWIWTVFQFIVLISRHQCTAAYTDIGAKAVSAASNVGSSNNLGTEYASAAMTCIEHFNGSLACAHSITFGLISAVVIHETGSSDESAKQRLTSMIQPMVRRQKIDANFFQRSVSTLITSLPTVYVVSWTIFGLTCFIYSITSPDGSTGPLFYTGQTWIGLLIKVTYSFFGIEPQDNASTPSNPSATGQTHLGRQGRGEV